MTIDSSDPGKDFFTGARSASNELVEGKGQTVYWEGGTIEVIDKSTEPAKSIKTYKGAGSAKIPKGFDLHIVSGRFKELY